jgi:TolA-binding protein
MRRNPIRICRMCGNTLFLSLVLALLTVSAGFGQEEMSASGLLTEATQRLADGDYQEAVPYMTDYLERMKESDDPRVLALLQDVRFKLGKIMLHLEDSAKAAEFLDQYTSNKPLYKFREAHKLLAVSLYEIGEYQRCVETVTNAFAGPPEMEETEEEKVDFESLKKEELGGLTARQLKRYEERAEEADDDLFSGFTEEAPEEEPEYTPAERVLLNMTLAQAYTGLEEWEKSLDPYRYVIENSDEEARRGFAIMETVNALVKLDRYIEAGTFISKLYETEARYDIRVNMALVSAASAMFNEAEYDSALMLYRMVLPREALVDYKLSKMNELRQEAELPPVRVRTVTNEVGRVETLFGKKHGEAAGMEDEAGQNVKSEIKPIEVIELEEQIASLQSMPPYEEDVLYRTGQLYAEAGRPWEAVAVFDVVASHDPESELGLRVFFEKMQVLFDPLKEYEQLEELGLAFLDTHREGITPRQVAYQLTAVYQIQQRMKDIKSLLPYIESFVPSDEFMVRQYEAELYYMQAVADLMLLNYKQALAGFASVLEDFSDSHQQDNATYWHAVARLFLQDYEKALFEFEAYANEFSRGEWLPEASFRGGICLFGMERYEEAQARFTHVINTWPDSSVYPDACSMRGDILGSQGLLDEALRDYREAMDTARRPQQATYAVFQMASVFEAEERYDEIIELVNSYLDRYDEEADVAKAAYWIGKTKMEQGRTDEAVHAYLDTVVKYGGDVRQDGVDLIIAELVNISRWMEEEDFNRLISQVEMALENAEDRTLELRLKVLLATLNNAEMELGRQLIAELDDLTTAPPPVLSVICEASLESGDFSRAQDILIIFQNRFEDSEYMRAAYKLCGHDFYHAGKYDEAMEIVEETQALYGMEDDAAWAQLMKGRIELRNGQLDRARETFLAVLNVQAWRGEPYAEATYSLGEVEENAGNLRKAFAWYQRAYFQYKGHAQGLWAAKGYLGSARILQELDRENDRRNTFRAMLFDRYVNDRPEADVAREALGAAEVAEIKELIEGGIQTNITVTIEAEAEKE